MSTRPTLNLLLLLRADVCAFAIKERHAQISDDSSFFTTRLRGVAHGEVCAGGVVGHHSDTSRRLWQGDH